MELDIEELKILQMALITLQISIMKGHTVGITELQAETIKIKLADKIQEME